MATRFANHLLEGDHASRPAFGDVPEGTLYACTTHSLIYQSDGTSAWSTWATLGETGTAAHVSDTTDAHDASAISFTPDGSIAATDVQAAIVEVRDEAAGGLDLSAMTIERRAAGVSDYLAGYDASAADERGFPIGHLRMGRGHTVFASDCMLNATGELTGTGASLDGGIMSFPSGTGAQIGRDAAAAMTASHPGILLAETGTTTTGRAVLGNQDSAAILLGAGKVRFGVVFKLTTLSDGTQTYTVRSGLGDVFAGESVDFVGFRYTNAVNGGEWQGVCRSNNTESTLDTNVAADTNWHTFEAEINAGATSVEFFIDGASVGTISSNVPTGAGREVTMLPFHIIKSAGSTNRTAQIDAYWYIFEFTTAR